MMRDYTRAELIAICERAASVQECDWQNRDSHEAIVQVGKCWALLKAGAEFEIIRHGITTTDEQTIWLDITVTRTYWNMDYGVDSPAIDTFYLPTPSRLESSAGKDWY